MRIRGYGVPWYEDEIRIASGYVWMPRGPGIGVETKSHPILSTLLD
jgi:hypothetical protein